MRTREEQVIIEEQKWNREAFDSLIQDSRSDRQGKFFTKEQQDKIIELVAIGRELNTHPTKESVPLSTIKNSLYQAVLMMDGVGNRTNPSGWMNAMYPKQLIGCLKSIRDWKYSEKADRTRTRHEDTNKCECFLTGTYKWVLYTDSSGNVLLDNACNKRKTKDICDCPKCKKAQADALRRHREQKATTRERAARHEYKENRGKPDPEYVKAMEKRKKKLRDEEGAPSREERRKSLGF